MKKRPSSCVTASYCVPDGTCTAVTVAPGTTAPCGSATWPAIEPVVTPCAAADPAEATSAQTTAIAQKHRDQREFLCAKTLRMDLTIPPPHNQPDGGRVIGSETNHRGRRVWDTRHGWRTKTQANAGRTRQDCGSSTKNRSNGHRRLQERCYNQVNIAANLPGEGAPKQNAPGDRVVSLGRKSAPGDPYGPRARVRRLWLGADALLFQLLQLLGALEQLVGLRNQRLLLRGILFDQRLLPEQQVLVGDRLHEVLLDLDRLVRGGDAALDVVRFHLGRHRVV